MHSTSPHPIPVGLALTSLPMAATESYMSSQYSRSTTCGYNASIMHTAVSATLLTYVVLKDASAVDIARAFAIPMSDVLSTWVTTQTPLPRMPLLRLPLSHGSSEAGCDSRNALHEKHVSASKEFSSIPPQITAIPSVEDEKCIDHPLAETSDLKLNSLPDKQLANNYFPSSVNPHDFFALLKPRLNALKEAMEDEGGELFCCGRIQCVSPKVECRSSARCGWYQDTFRTSRVLTSQTHISENGLVASRTGENVYCGARLKSAVNLNHLLAQNGKIAAYVEFDILVGGGICIGVGSSRASLNKLIGADDDFSSVGFHENGCLVHGSTQWTPHCAPYRSGDVVGVLICRAADSEIVSCRKHRTVTSGTSSCSTSGSVASGDDESDASCAYSGNGNDEISMRRTGVPPINCIYRKVFETSGQCVRQEFSDSSHCPVTVTFFVNGIAGSPVILSSPSPRVYATVSLYGRDARIRVRCCEKNWRHFPQAARFSRPACLVSHCSGTCSFHDIAAVRRARTTIITESVQSTKLPANSRPVTVLRSKVSTSSTSNSSQATSCHSLLTP